MLSHFSSMAVRSSWILYTLSYTLIQSIPNMLNGWHLVSMQAMEELGHFQLPGMVYRPLWHRAVHYHAETWGDGGEWIAWQWASGSQLAISMH
jgi:hypothetical protein